MAQEQVTVSSLQNSSARQRRKQEEMGNGVLELRKRDKAPSCKGKQVWMLKLDQRNAQREELPTQCACSGSSLACASALLCCLFSAAAEQPVLRLWSNYLPKLGSVSSEPVVKGYRGQWRLNHVWKKSSLISQQLTGVTGGKESALVMALSSSSGSPGGS